MSRIQSVDVCRLIAIFAVILIHTLPFSPPKPEINGRFGELGWAINQATRFAVPFFFIVAGYFWALKQRTSADPDADSWAMGRRIALLFVVWSLIYLLPFDIQAMRQHGLLGPAKMFYWNVVNWLADPVELVLQGSKLHLWFLPALLSALAVCAFAMRRGWHRGLAIVAVLMFTAGLLSKAYSQTALGFHLPFDARNGPFMATMLFGIGVFLSRRTAAPGWLLSGSALFAAGMAIQVAELYWLSQLYGTAPYQDFTFGTCLMGIGFAMAALSNHRWLQSRRFGGIGQYTLGIYAVHMVFVDLLRGVRTVLVSPLWELAYPMIVLALSVAAVLLMARSPILRRIVA